MPHDELLRIDEVLERVALSKATLYRMVTRGGFPHMPTKAITALARVDESVVTRARRKVLATASGAPGKASRRGR